MNERTELAEHLLKLNSDGKNCVKLLPPKMAAAMPHLAGISDREGADEFIAVAVQVQGDRLAQHNPAVPVSVVFGKEAHGDTRTS